MPSYRDGQSEFEATVDQLNVDNLSVLLEGARVASFLHGYDAVGDNWDRIPTSAAGLLVDTELPAASALADNEANPTVPRVGSMLMVYDGATWDRVRGDLEQGLDVDPTRLPNLSLQDFDTGVGTVNQYSVGIVVSAAGGPLAITGDATGLDVDTELPAAAALADNTANPTAPAVGSFSHWWDGATWDRAPGNSVDGLTVNLGANNDVDTELPAAAALSDAAANPTTPTVGAAILGYNGATWDRLRSTTADGLDVDPTRLPNLSLTDFDTGAGTVNNYSIGIAVAAAGGPVAITGDVANGLDVDVTRVSGTVTVDSELPAAAALADDEANPTVPRVGAMLAGFDQDNTQWDRLRTLTPNSDAVGALQGTLRVASFSFLANGTDFDRERNNSNVTALASAARTATTTSASLVNYNWRGMLVAIDVTAVGAPAGTLTQLEVLALVGTTEVVLYTFNFADLAAIGTRHMLVYPGAFFTAPVDGLTTEGYSVDPVNGTVPRTFRIRVTHLDGNSITYSVTCQMIL